MRLRRRQDPRDRLRRRVAESVARADVGQRVAGTADRIAGRVQHVATDARGTLAAFEPPGRRRSHRRGGLVATALLVVAAVAIGVAWWRRHHRDEEYARLTDAPTEPFAGPAAPSSPGGVAAPVDAGANGHVEPVAPVASAPSAAAPAEAAPAQPWNRATTRTEARLASRSLLDSSTALPRFDAIKPPAPRFDPPGPSYGKFTP